MQELGLDVHWEVISGPPDFYRVTKAIHNGLQGLPVVTEAQRLRAAPRSQQAECRTVEPGRRRGRRARSAADLPAGLHAARDRCKRWVWRCHVDASRAQPRGLEASGGRDPALPGDDLLDGGLRAAPAVPDLHDSALDRSAFRQELPDSRGGTAGNLEPAQHRPRTAPVAAGFAVRSFQGSAGRDCRLSHGEAVLSRNCNWCWWADRPTTTPKGPKCCGR